MENGEEKMEDGRGERSVLCSPCSVVARMRELLPGRMLDLFVRIGELGDEMGMNVYVVGGLPRDLALGRPSYDVDVVVEGDGLAFARAFAGRMGGSVTCHKRFGTAIVGIRPGQKMDVATARKERYPHPGALPEVTPDGIEPDLYRRDFTINSMAIQVNRSRYGRLVDPFGGLRDLRVGVLRVLHDGSFLDDPTRILRGVRFEQRYGFCMEGRTIRLLIAAVEDRMLDRVTGQRLRDEIVLILKEDDPGPSILRLQQFGVLEALCTPLGTKKPASPYSSGQGFERIRRTLRWFREIRPKASIESWIVYLLGLISALSPDERGDLAERLCLHRRARLSVEDLSLWKRAVEARLADPKEIRSSEIYGLLRRFSQEVVLFVMACPRNDLIGRRVRTYLEALQDVSPSITGRDLHCIGIPEGPAFGRILEEIRAAKLDGLLTSREEELELARTMAARCRGHGDGEMGRWG